MDRERLAPSIGYVGFTVPLIAEVELVTMLLRHTSTHLKLLLLLVLLLLLEVVADLLVCLLYLLAKDCFSFKRVLYII